MKKVILPTIIALLFAWPVYGAFPVGGSSQNAYCQVPPYLATSVKPNINLVLDFSGSMQFPAYLDCSSFPGYDASKVANCGTYTFNAGSKFLYDSNHNYYGNFKSNMYYKYNAGGFFEENAGCSSPNTFANNCVSGNLLNWAVTTRTDVLRRILTGGRLKSGFTDVLESEGSRYIFTDTTLHCKFTVTASATTSRLLTVANQTGYTCAIGTGGAYNMDVKTSTPADITGTVQSIYPNLVDLELSVYNTTLSSSASSYRVGKNKPLANYVSAINSELAYNGTPTGEAIREAQYYFQQSNSMAAKNRNGQATVGDVTDSMLGVANYLKDPYYDSGAIPVPCRKSYVLLISDGEWNGSIDPVGPAHTMHKTDMRTDAALNQLNSAVPPTPAKQTVSTYTVFAFSDSVSGRQAMITTALFGGYSDDDANGWPYTFSSLPNSLGVAYPRANCNPGVSWNAQCAEWANDSTGLPNNFYEAQDGAALQAAIAKAVNDIQQNTSSGTAASVMGNNDSSGAMLLQALYFPEKQQIGVSKKTTWLGELQSFWYYIDPLLTYINIREDTVSDNKLKLANDRIASFDFNGSQTEVNLYNDIDGDGGADTPTIPVGTVSVDDVKALWRAGKSLWSRSASDRTIYVNDPTVTTYQGSRISFDTTTSLTALRPYLDVAGNTTDATNVINYTLGDNVTGYRDRNVTISGTTNVWKLSDIIGSSPRLLTPININSYHFADDGYRDKSYDTFINSKVYKERNVAVAGANDGMLHAFQSGKNVAVQNSSGSSGFLSKLTKGDGTTPTNWELDLGKELWGFVPKNALPYLKHIGDPSYKHLFFVNATPYLLDASIGLVDKICSNDNTWCSTNSDCTGTAVCNTVTSCSGPACPKYPASWRTVLIGSMGLGGATRDSTASCTDCVKTPIPGIGYSSYFALDVTDTTKPPVLLWEFSNPRLGFTTGGPAVIRIKDSSEASAITSVKNGNWYVVLASGPTGPIDTATNQMKGLSDQPLSIFVLDLKTGTPIRTFSNDAGPLISGVGHTTVAAMPSFAFGGSLFNATIDSDQWDIDRPGAYSDDGLYLGYTSKDTSTGNPYSGKFVKGGVLRLLTGDDPDPANWKVSTVIDNIGPVTSAVTKLQNTFNKELWLFFGTGRYFYKIGLTIDEDFTGQREAIYGVKEPCYVTTDNDLSNVNCTASVTLPIVDQTTSINLNVDNTKGGWKINLAQASGNFNAQRIVTNPIATSTGTLFFVAMKPTADICGYGGTSSMWIINYNNGAAPSPRLHGSILLQKTTGATETIDIGPTPLPNSLNRESAQGTGLTSGDSPPVLSNADHFPSKKILHIQER